MTKIAYKILVFMIPLYMATFGFTLALGYHNIDIGHNLGILNAMDLGMTFQDRMISGNTIDQYEAYSIGTIQIVVSAFMLMIMSGFFFYSLAKVIK